MLKYSHDASGNMVSRTLENVLPPQITGQPIKQVAAPGNVAAFSVSVSDASKVAFQWKFNGIDIPGATGDSLLLINVSAANEGQYSVAVTNSAGSVMSTPAALMLDNDGDGLPDSWEIANFGDTTSQRSEGDPDGDGSSNLDEFLDGTDPMSDTSLRPRLIAYSDAGGAVTVAPMKLSYDLGETVTLTATPFAPSVFGGWMGDMNGSSNPATLTMNGNKTVRARFVSIVALPSGLVAFWRGETDASDLIGGHHGTFFAGMSVAAPSLTADGKVGSAFAFDGTLNIQVPDAVELHPSEMTVEAWVFPSLLSGNHQTIVARGSATTEDSTWWIGVLNGLPRFWSQHIGSGMLVLEAPSAIPLNQWSHLAISFDGSIKRLYVNGAQVAWHAGLGALIYDAAPVPVTIAADWTQNAPSEIFSGRLDEVSLYNRALTDDEVLGIYNATFLGKSITQPYFTSPSQLPDVVLGANYTDQVTTALGTNPVSFSLSAGALPPGMTLSSGGALSGVPGAAGTFGFTVRATDAVDSSTEQLCVLRVLQPVALPAGLVAWWRGEPATGSVVPDVIGGHDGGFFSGNSSAAPTYMADGKVGSAFAFDGTMYVRVPDSAELKPAQITVEAWVFPSLLSGNHQTIVARGSATTEDSTWWMGVLDGLPRFWSQHAGSGMLVLEAPSTIPLNQWSHLAISFDGSIKRLYVNGAQVAWHAGLGALIYDAASVPVTIAADWTQNAPSEIFSGRLDEVSLYNRALTDDEVLGIYNATFLGKSATQPYFMSPSQLPDVVLGANYTDQMTTILGTNPVNFSLSAGALPPGMTLSSGGVLSGAPGVAGTFGFTVRATDAVDSFTEQLCVLRVLQPIAPPAGLVAWWRGETAIGSVVPDVIGGHHGSFFAGTSVAAPSLTADGKVGSAFAFDGTLYVQVPDAMELHPSEMTVEAWVFPTLLSGNHQTIVARGSATNEDSTWWMGVLDGLPRFWSQHIGSGMLVLEAPSAIPLNQWSHLAISFDGTIKRLYVNGVQMASQGGLGALIYDAAPVPVTIAADWTQNAPSEIFSGRLDEVSLYNRALNGTEIASIYNANFAGKHLLII